MDEPDAARCRVNSHARISTGRHNLTAPPERCAVSLRIIMIYVIRRDHFYCHQSKTRYWANSPRPSTRNAGNCPVASPALRHTKGLLPHHKFESADRLTIKILCRGGTKGPHHRRHETESASHLAREGLCGADLPGRIAFRSQYRASKGF
jgi:hypothetical protein